MVNIIAINAQTFTEFPHHFHMSWCLPTTILVSTILLWKQLGIAAVAGVIIMAIMVPLNSILNNKSKMVQIQKQKHQDSRIKILNEVLNGIKVN